MGKMEYMYVGVGIAILLCLLIGVGGVAGETGTQYFSDLGTDMDYSEIDGSGAHSVYNPIDHVAFYEIEDYPHIDYIKANYSGCPYKLDVDAPSSASTAFSCAYGEGTIWYADVGSHIEAYLLFDSWDIGTATGEKWIPLSYDNNALYNLKFKEGSNAGVFPASPFGFTATQYPPYAYTLNGYYELKSTYEWHNKYEWWDEKPDFERYHIDVSKNVYGTVYQSKWKIWTDKTTYVEETSLNTFDFSTTALEYPVYLRCENQYGTIYEETIFLGGKGKVTVFGHTYNAETGEKIPIVTVRTHSMDCEYVDTSDVSGYYSLSFPQSIYTINANKEGYYDVVLHNLVFPDDGDYELDIYLLHKPPVSTKPSILGLVRELPNYYPAKSQVVTIENATWMATTTTNEYGYYIFHDLEAGDYKVEVEKNGYEPNSHLIGVSDFRVLHNIDLEPKGANIIRLINEWFMKWWWLLLLLIGLVVGFLLVRKRKNIYIQHPKRGKKR